MSRALSTRIVGRFSVTSLEIKKKDEVGKPFSPKCGDVKRSNNKKSW